MEVNLVLLIDDEDVVRLTTSLILKKLGVTVVAMSNGLEAFEYYKNNSDSVDLIILDHHMPEISGLELFGKLKEFDDSVRVVISSGFVDDDEKAKFNDIGIFGMLNKPFSVADLRNILEKIS